jgi:hypothetical protein
MVEVIILFKVSVTTGGAYLFFSANNKYASGIKYVIKRKS